MSEQLTPTPAQVGRETDIEVAEKIFGLMPCDKWQPTYGGWLAGECWMHELQSPDSRHKCYNVASPPHYSTEISAAWEVVEKLKPAKPLKLQWYFWIQVWDAEFGEHAVQAPTAPLAICLAALSASKADSTTKGEA